MNRSTHCMPGFLSNLQRTLAYGGLLALSVTNTARADDSEIFVAQSTSAPNIMLILDTSGSMIGKVTTQSPYDPKRDYVAEGTGACSGLAGKVFYRTGKDQGTPPSCGTNDQISASNLKCAAAVTALASDAGRYQGDRFIQWRRTSKSTRQWRTLSNDYDTAIECRNDNGIDGNLATTTPYPDSTASSTNDTPVWTNTTKNSFWSNNVEGGTSATIYSANYIVYFNQFRTTELGTRLSVMQQAARELLNSLSNVNIGLMRYSVNTTDANGGGMVLAPVAPISTNRGTLIALVNGLIPYGATPLSETLYEAHQYFAGDKVVFGNSSTACSSSTPNGDGTTTNCSGSIGPLRSTPSSRVGGAADGSNYLSPADDSCETNFIVYLTDGEPTSDNTADTAITGLGGFSDLVKDGCRSSGEGRCLGALSEYMFKKDLRGNAVAGEQNVTTYFIGFGASFGGTSNAAFEYLKDAGKRGGGDAYQAGDLADLTTAFTNIFDSILDRSTTLTAPTVAVNAFNRTRTLNDLYVSVFQPAAGTHWPGNVKKYGIDSKGNIIDREKQLAIEATTGFFKASTSDVWSKTNADGPAVKLGGAASLITMPPDTPATRKLYTYVGANPNAPVKLTGNAYSLHSDNALVSDTLLATNATDDPLRKKLIDWARGADVKDEDADGQVDDARLVMGDPMHAQPAIVIYGGTTTAKDTDDAVVFSTTNNGYLHAIDVASGKELWSFIPQEMLPRLHALYTNQNSAIRNYGLDGDIRVLKYDVNGDGIVDPAANDRVLIYFSTGRSATASRYYALDVTDKDEPEFLWSIGPTQLPALGQAWSPPAVARVNVDGETQNSQKLVLIFGGGYDPAEEAGPYVNGSSAGHRIFMVDAINGNLLWNAGDDNTDLKLPRMTHSIPAAITVLDLNGDGYADRMYAGDMGAQLWRFDIYNGKDAAGLVTGGVIASLGSHDESPHTAANTRRFYNAPDAAALQLQNGPPFINLAIGSGYRGRPLSIATQDRFYSVRDHRPFAKLTQDEYNKLTILGDSDLLDVTTNLSPSIAPTAAGWKIRMDQPGGTWRGEKVLAESNTFQNMIFFTTYTPSASATSNACTLAVGSNRAYAISAFDASPRLQRDDEIDPTDPTPAPVPDPSPEDRFDELFQGGIAPEITFLFPEKDQVVCLSGVEVLSVCTNFKSRVKTYWRDSNAN